MERNQNCLSRFETYALFSKEGCAESPRGILAAEAAPATENDLFGDREGKEQLLKAVMHYCAHWNVAAMSLIVICLSLSLSVSKHR